MIDHAVILVEDLAQARAEAEAAGFRPTPEGRHPTLGSANHCLMLNETYIELLKPGVAGGWSRWIGDAGAGLAAIALRTEDIEADRARLADYAPSEVLSFGRPVEGLGEARFRIILLAPERTGGFHLFLCQHLTPALVWREGYVQSGAVRAVRLPRPVPLLATETGSPALLVERAGTPAGQTAMVGGCRIEFV